MGFGVAEMGLGMAGADGSLGGRALACLLACQGWLVSRLGLGLGLGLGVCPRLLGLSARVGVDVMVASYLSSSYLISASILSNLSNLSAHLISYFIYGCGLVSS